MDTNNYTDYVGDGYVYYGADGCGKTTRLCEKALKAKDPIILSFTNKAIENPKNYKEKEQRQMFNFAIHLTHTSVNIITEIYLI